MALNRDLSRKFSPAIEAQALRLSQNVLAEKLTTFALGGPITQLVEVQSLEVLLEVLAEISQLSLPWRIIGNGSNLLVSSSGLDEVVVKLGSGFAGWTLREDQSEQALSLIQLSAVSRQPSLFAPSGCASGENVRLLAFGASSLMGLSRKTCEQGMSGLEFAAGIPASLGGAVKMNAGAHGGEMAEVVRRVYVLSDRGELRCMLASNLQFAYRHTNLSAQDLVIAAELELQVGERELVKAQRARCLEYRRRTQPLHLPSAGSVFVNPLECGGEKTLSAGQLLEQLGFKGRRLGGVAFSQMHANWLVKCDSSGRSEDALQLIAEAKDRAGRQGGLQLKSEIVVW